MAQLIKPQIQWTQDKIQLLRDTYPEGDIKKLAKELGITLDALACSARRFNLTRSKCRNKMRKLIKFDNLNCLYWLGYIIADGHIRPKGHFSISSSIKDISQLEKLKIFLGSTREITKFWMKSSYTTDGKEKEYCKFSENDLISCKEILEKFQLFDKAKTYNPPSLDILDTKEKFLAFFIGFFDGDGCLDKDNKGNVHSLKIEVHQNWMDTLSLFKLKLLESGIESNCSFSTRGYAQIRINTNKAKRLLKLFVIDNNLPVLERKWDSIDENKILGKDVISENIIEILRLRVEGVSVAKIARKFSVGPAGLYNELKRRSKINCGDQI